MDKSELITRCLDEILEGKASLEDCLREHPELGADLRDLLSVAAGVRQQRVDISPDFKLKARSHLFDAKDLVREGRKTGVFDWLRPMTLANRLRTTMAAALVVAGLGGGTGVVYAAQGSLPGEALYPVKLGSENVRLALTLTSDKKGELNLELAERRVEEAVIQSARGQAVSAATPKAVAKHLDAVINEIEDLDEDKSRLLISQLSASTINQQVTLNQLLVEAPEMQAELEETMGASRRASTVAVMADANPAFLSSQPSVTDKKLEQTYFTLEGILQSVGDDWNIGGTILKNVSLPKDADYTSGGRIAVEGIIRDGKTFITSLKPKEGTSEEVRLEGMFSGTSPDGSVWYVSGIPINKPQDLEQVSEGSDLNLTSTMQNGNVVVSGQASSDQEEKRNVKVTGKLIEVSSDNTVIVIKVAGAKITTNIEGAEIKVEDTSGLDKSGLRSLIGQEVRVSGLKSQDGVIYASKVFIENENRERTSGDADTRGDTGSGDRD